MARALGTVTLDTAGTQTFNLGIAPTWVTLTVCASNATTDTVDHKSEGKATAVKQYCQSTFCDDSSGKRSFNSSAHVVQHYERVSGSITKVLSASFSAFTTNGITLNVDTPHSNYKVLIEAGN